MRQRCLCKRALLRRQACRRELRWLRWVDLGVLRSHRLRLGVLRIMARLCICGGITGERGSRLWRGRLLGHVLRLEWGVLRRRLHGLRIRSALLRYRLPLRYLLTVLRSRWLRLLRLRLR